MKEKFITYLQTPTLENFLSVREALLKTDKFNPYSDELDDVPARLESGDFKSVVEKIHRHLWPNHLLSPGAHFHLSFACHKLGQEQEAQAEYFIYGSLMRGIEQTGDGTPDKPFLVSRTSDEYDYLFAHRLSFAGQALMMKNGREFDVMSVEGRDSIWFDITEIKHIMERQF